MKKLTEQQRIVKYFLGGGDGSFVFFGLAGLSLFIALIVLLGGPNKYSTADQEIRAKMIKYGSIVSFIVFLSIGIAKTKAKKDFLTDEQYMELLGKKRMNVMNQERVLEKLGLDESQVREINPVTFEGFVYSDAYVRQQKSGKWVSSRYQITWLFFSSTQVYVYENTFNMEKEKEIEGTEEYFYKDITSFSTKKETVTSTMNNNNVEIEENKFCIIVPGDQLTVAVDKEYVPNFQQSVHAMQQKLREKKMG